MLCVLQLAVALGQWRRGALPELWLKSCQGDDRINGRWISSDPGYGLPRCVFSWSSEKHHYDGLDPNYSPCSVSSKECYIFPLLIVLKRRVKGPEISLLLKEILASVLVTYEVKELRRKEENQEILQKTKRQAVIGRKGHESLKCSGPMARRKNKLWEK
ncbi:hypothetical protein EDB86DRAFT_3243291 [Lactarius hatsudake]|nr:hypothetical protein EDB86DRAFT_3243291 [Lactarius hatsudake]